MEDEMNAMMGDEMAPMMEAEKPAEEETAEDVSIARTQELTPCCCCLCACSNEYTKDSRCRGCFPIKCSLLETSVELALLVRGLAL